MAGTSNESRGENLCKSGFMRTLNGASGWGIGLFFCLTSHFATAEIPLPSSAIQPAPPHHPLVVPPPLPSGSLSVSNRSRPPAAVQPLRLRLELRDGSLIIGAPAATNLPVRGALGNIQVDLPRLVSGQFADDRESVSLLFRNGDRVTGRIGWTAFEVSTCFGSVKIPLAEVRRFQVMPGGQGLGALLNVNFGGGQKTGCAAIGLGERDFWNSHVGQYAALSGAADLQLSTGESTTVGLSVRNAGGVWGNKSGDSMYDSYIYPNSGQGDGVGQVIVTVTNLPGGSYDFYLYGHADAGGRSESNSQFSLKAGDREYGPVGALSANGWKAVEPWVEGKQFVVLRDVQVTSGDEVVITVAAGFNGQATDGVAVINGFQITPAGLFPRSARVAD